MRIDIPGEPEMQLGGIQEHPGEDGDGLGPMMYWGVPKNLAAFSAMRSKASFPNAPCCSTCWCSDWLTSPAARSFDATRGVFLTVLPVPALTSR